MVMLILVVQVSAGIAAYIMKSELKDALRENVRESMLHYNETNVHIYKTWNVLQHDVSSDFVKWYK